MKNKFLGKLILSGAALAACATTLVTSTYAWYTSNTEVSTDSLSGTTSAEADSNSIYISSAQTYNGRKGATWSNYTSSVELVKSATTDITLVPVSYDSTSNEYKAMSSATGATITYAADSKSTYLEFNIRFRAAGNDATPVYIKEANITNESTGTPQTAIAYGNGTGITAAGTYLVDFLKAVKMNVSTYAVKVVDGVVEDESTDENPSLATYDLTSYAKIADKNVTGANAIGYYNTVTGNSIQAPEDYIEIAENNAAVLSGTSPICTVPANAYIELNFVFFLDGWDEYCYDVCRGQKLSVGFTFSTTANSNNSPA